MQTRQLYEDSTGEAQELGGHIPGIIITWGELDICRY